MTAEFERVSDPVLGEELLLATTAKGVRVRLAPTDRFQEAVGVVSVGYGSTDVGFRLDGAVHASPEGVAHYLEHKLFEDEDLHVFDRFGRRGARVNAMTGFTRTTYYFQTTGEFDANLADLLRLVSRAHLTDANVEKERGIIAQELKMHEDSPEYRAFFDLLGCLYSEHPVRHPVGGTVESIAGIDVAELSICHRAFYRTGNVAFAAAGPIDPVAVLRQIEAWDLAEGEAPESLFPADLGPPRRRLGGSTMAVERPRVVVGFKERTLCEVPEQRLSRELATRVLLDRLLGPSSEIREDLHRRGLIDDSISYSYTGERSFGFTLVGCETDRPHEVGQALREVLTTPVAIDDDHLDRVRRKVLGQYVRSFDAVQRTAFGYCDEALEDIAPFRVMDRVRALTTADVVARQAEHLVADNSAIAVVAS